MSEGEKEEEIISHFYLSHFLQFLICFSQVYVQLGGSEVAVFERVCTPRGIEDHARDLHQTIPQQESDNEEPPCVGRCG